MALLLALLGVVPSLWSQNSWTGGGDGSSWGDASNWTAGVPTDTQSIHLGDGSPDTEQTINLGVDRLLSESIHIESSGSRNYVISEASLDFLRTESSPTRMGFISGSGTGTLTVNSNVEFSDTLTGGNSYLDVYGTGSRSIVINGAVTSGTGGGASKRFRMDAANTQLHIFGSIAIGSVSFLSGEIVMHSTNALGTSQLQQGNNSTLSVATNVNIGATNAAATYLSSNLNVRIREDSLSDTDRVMTFLGRLVSSSTNGTLTISPNVNSSGCRTKLRKTSKHRFFCVR